MIMNVVANATGVSIISYSKGEKRPHVASLYKPECLHTENIQKVIQLHWGFKASQHSKLTPTEWRPCGLH